ncbi:MAG: penicillin acylase family protein, partial [Acidobacteriota bacterium]
MSPRARIALVPTRIPALFLALILIPIGAIPAIPAGAATPAAPAATFEAAFDGIEAGAAPVRIPGLLHSVRVRTDALGVPHVFAVTDRDAQFVLGYLHARDRFFQMDLLRRQFSGDLAELLGEAALGSDVQLRTLGLRRAAEASLPALSAVTRVWLEAYARGVNAYLADNPLPPEYGALELTSARPWTPVDSVTIGKGLAFGLSFDLSDIELTEALLTFQAAGLMAGFDGSALFSEDLYRSAPFDPTISVPTNQPAASADAVTPFPGRQGAAAPFLGRLHAVGAADLLRAYRERIEDVPILARALRPRWDRRGSNWWIVSGDRTDSGHPILANDPHLGLDSPSIFYEAQLRIDPREGRPAMNAFGVTFPGVPGIVLGCNPWICWGATTNPMDVTDVYLEQLVVDPATGLPVGTRFEDTVEPIVPIPQTYRVNRLDGTPDNPVTAGVPPAEGGVTLIVPRRNHGPIVQVDASNPAAVTGLSVQYTGWGATRELDAFQKFNRAGGLDDFREAVQFFDVGSQNFAYADVNGNIAYFTSAELPLREDLQTLNTPDGGIPPWLIRDGTHTLHHEWLPADPADLEPQQILPYRILPYDEMPQTVNPARGFVLNANNDPVGTTVDNNPVNQLRPGGGLYYLSPGYAAGFRAGRIRRLIESGLADGGTLGFDQIAAFQANNQLLDAEVLVPYLL